MRRRTSGLGGGGPIISATRETLDNGEAPEPPLMKNMHSSTNHSYSSRLFRQQERRRVRFCRARTLRRVIVGVARLPKTW